VTFDIDANGILHVSAKDLGTGKEQKITITASSGLSKDEVEKMVHDAEQHASDDQQRRETVETRNQADNLAYSTEKLLKEQGEKVDAAKKAKVEEAVRDLREAIKAEDTARMKAAMERVNTEVQSISEDLYAKARAQQQQAGDAPGGEAAEGGGAKDAGAAPGKEAEEGDVIDADFTMVDDDKKGG